MNFNPASVVAAAAAAAHQTFQHHHHHNHHPHLNHHQTTIIHHQQQHQHQQQLIPLPVGGGGGQPVGDISPKIMEWTNDDALELIEQYRCHTELWNRADPKYKDKLCRFRAWSEIAERFGCSKAEVERKMNVLLTQYRREKHKMFVKIYQGIQPNPSKWYAFKRFDFMEAGGGSLSGGGGGVGGPGGPGLNASSGNLVPNPVSSSAAAAAHNGLNGLAAAAAAAAYESGTIAAAGNGGAPVSGPGGGGAPGSQPAMQHRRIKTKELKYFGAMGLNIPMLIASSQTLDSWNTAGQYSPPISGSGGGGSERGGSGGGGVPPQQLRVPLPMSYHGGTGGGGSSSSDFQQSPLKTMDTSDNEDNNNTKEDVAAAAALGQLAAKVELRSPVGGGGGGGGPNPGGGGSSSRDANDPASDPIKSDRTLSEAGSSPGIPNTNMHEAHKNHLLNSPAGGGGRAVTPRQAHEQMHHHSHPHTQHHLQQQQLQQQQQQLQQQQQQQQHLQQQQLHHGHEDLDIKQELVDYFHGQAAAAAGVGGGPAPPPPPESHRSYSSAGEESRLQLVDMAQDLRVAQAKANFSAFVLPPRGSSDATGSTPVAMPLNMRKLTGSTGSAGHMLMNSLLGSRESMSDGEEPDPDNDEATESATSPGRHIKSSVSAQAAVAASAFYAESLNRDDCDFIGSNVSLKLRTMDRTQRIIAEKLISEVLYYGQFNELERSARIQPK
nr:AT-rich interactive domain-containing protein 1B isoform X1 [Drosophila suzukii]